MSSSAQMVVHSSMTKLLLVDGWLPGGQVGESYLGGLEWVMELDSPWAPEDTGLQCLGMRIHSGDSVWT